MKTLGVSEKQIIKLEISANILKKNFFNTLKQHYFFNFIYSFEGVWYFWVKLCIFFSKLLSATRQQLFYVLNAICYVLTRTFKPCSTPLGATAFSTVIYIKLWWTVKDLQKNQ